MGWEELEDEARASELPKGPRCAVSVLLDMILDEHGQSAGVYVVRALANPRLTSAALRKALMPRVEDDYLPSVYSIQRHRSGRCNCRLGD